MHGFKSIVNLRVYFWNKPKTAIIILNIPYFTQTDIIVISKHYNTETQGNYINKSVGFGEQGFEQEQKSFNKKHYLSI